MRLIVTVSVALCLVASENTLAEYKHAASSVQTFLVADSGAIIDDGGSLKMAPSAGGPQQNQYQNQYQRPAQQPGASQLPAMQNQPGQQQPGRPPAPSKEPTLKPPGIKDPSNPTDEELMKNYQKMKQEGKLPQGMENLNPGQVREMYKQYMDQYSK
jgi:hypothetical protein